MFFDHCKAFDPQLDDLEYIDMSGANLLKTGNSSKELNHSSSSPEYKTSTPNCSRYIPRIEKPDDNWSNLILQDLAPSLPNSPPDSVEFMAQTPLGDREETEDTYVTILGSPTYLDPVRTSCVDTSCDQTNKRDSTYMSIAAVPETPVAVRPPPALPNRRYSYHTRQESDKFTEVRTRSKSDACHSIIAQRRNLSRFRPRPDDVLSAIGTRHYTVKEVFDSVADLTKDLPNADACYVKAENRSVKRHSSVHRDSYAVPQKICKRSPASKSASETECTYGFSHDMDTYDTFSSCRVAQQTVTKETHVYSTISDVRLPLTPRKDNHRRSFLEHLNSLSNVKLCRSKSRRSTSTMEQSFCRSSKSFGSSVKSPFKRKSFLRTNFRGLKRDKVGDVNNNGGFPEQPRFEFGVYSVCPKETQF